MQGSTCPQGASLADPLMFPELPGAHLRGGPQGSRLSSALKPCSPLTAGPSPCVSHPCRPYAPGQGAAPGCSEPFCRRQPPTSPTPGGRQGWGQPGCVPAGISPAPPLSVACHFSPQSCFSSSCPRSHVGGVDRGGAWEGLCWPRGGQGGSVPASAHSLQVLPPCTAGWDPSDTSKAPSETPPDVERRGWPVSLNSTWGTPKTSTPLPGAPDCAEPPRAPSSSAPAPEGRHHDARVTEQRGHPASEGRADTTCLHYRTKHHNLSGFR